ncbi:hypothetical protein NDU88_002551 [Pleurodeles waltl]|uniref:Uncharacterized protein n=1 Tax=Pleurodeles waltl TaxID=8319 RepID=A0AAV7WPU6_PLEWA|nr:hypothetical protein NDU88_002551 [Pleurodeles waltl]
MQAECMAFLSRPQGPRDQCLPRSLVEALSEAEAVCRCIDDWLIAAYFADHVVYVWWRSLLIVRRYFEAIRSVMRQASRANVRR